MYEDISIKLNPYLGKSNNLIEIFAIFGYSENMLLEYGSNIIKKQDNLDISLISCVISDLPSNSFNPLIVQKQIYPEKPKIIEYQQTLPPKPSSVVFYSCFDSLDAQSKIIYSCYALRFYEKYTYSPSRIYYVPKAFLIFSQYPYFTTYHYICQNLLEIISNNNSNIPIEVLIYLLINCVPSPIMNNLSIKLFPNKPEMHIQKLTGYPYADFDLCKILNILPINEFIKVYILVFLEEGLFFFSPNMVKLNLFMFILNILLYPFNDTMYNWHIKSINIKDLANGDEAVSSFRGVNAPYNKNLNFSNFKYLKYIIDLESKKIQIVFRNTGDEKILKEYEEINKLLEYVQKILNNKRAVVDNSAFLAEYILSLKNKLTIINNEYNSNRENNIPDNFLYNSENINKTNRKIQETFYDFILNILVVLYKDYELDSNKFNIIKKKNNINKNYSNEENIFIKLVNNCIRNNTYFENYVQHFESIDELKVSLIFSDEYVNLKIKDIKKQIPDNIEYFKLMDNLYSLNPSNQKIIDFSTLNNGILPNNIRNIINNNDNNINNNNKNNNNMNDNDINNNNINNNNNKYNNKNKLFKIDENLLKIFLFYKKNRKLLDKLNIQKKKKYEMEKIEKTSVIITLQNYFYSILNTSHYIRSSIVYIFSIVFPFFTHDKIIEFLNQILSDNNFGKIKFFHRYYLYIILKSIHKYYQINKENGQFPQLSFENIKAYCDIIKEYLYKQNIIPNEEIFKFLKIVFDKEKEKNNINLKGEKSKKIKINNKNLKENNKDEDNDNNINNIKEDGNEINNIINIKEDENEINNLINIKEDENEINNIINIKEDENEINNIINIKKDKNGINKDINIKEKKGESKPRFIFKYPKNEDYETIFKKNMIEIYDEESLSFKYKGETKKYSYLYSQPTMILQMVSSFYDDYFNTLNFDITKIQIEQLIVYIVNVICSIKNKNEDNLCISLLNSIIILNKLKNDVDKYNKSNNIKNNDKNSNKDNNINNINNINNNDNYSNSNSDIGEEEDEEDDNIICTSTKKKNKKEKNNIFNESNKSNGNSLNIIEHYL